MVSFSGLEISPEAIVEFLKQEIHLKETCRKIVCQQIVDRAAEEHGIAIASEEIQAEADQRRHQMRLESAAATYGWLNDQMITPEDWEAGIYKQLLARKLAEHLFASEVEKHFAEHRLDFEQVSLYRIHVPYQQLAQELFYQIEEGEISFYQAAHLYDVDEQRRLQCGYEGSPYRWSLKPDVAAIVFGARLGEVTGPFQSEDGYDLMMVEEFIAAELTPELRQSIVARMFKEWLDSELNYLLNHTENH